MSEGDAPSRRGHDGRSSRFEHLRAPFARAAAGIDVTARVARDPVSFPRARALPEDQELAALVAAQLAFGNVTTILAKVGEALAILERAGDGRLAAGVDALLVGEGPITARPLREALRGFRHRVFGDHDVVALIAGGRLLQRRHGSLGEAFAAARARGVHPEARAGLPPLVHGLAHFVDDLRAAGEFPRRGDPTRRGASHLLPDVARGAGAKRLLLFLRWMVRPEDGVDLGLWARQTPPPVRPAELLIPVDTHIHRLARNLGLTARADAGLATAAEITAALRSLDGEDPVRFDFALCHLGMSTACEERYVPEICQGCPLAPACVHPPKEKRPRRPPRS